MLVEIMGERFTSQDKSPEERNQQTTIAWEHTDFSQHDGTVVCDFQFAVPREYSREGKKLPIFDLVTFSMNKKTGGGVFTLVEYKCNADACKNEKSGLKKHANDMLHCMTDSTASDWCKRELLRRLGYMCRYGLLEHIPAVEHLRPEDVDLLAGFLFTSGDGLKSRHDAVELCRTYIPEKDLDKFLYCFAESPVDVDLSHMKNWEAFSGNK